MKDSLETVSAELAAMDAVSKALPNLDPDARVRVLDWARNVAVSTQKPYELAAETVQQMLALATAVRKHKAATREPQQADIDLWEAYERIGIKLPEGAAR